MTKCYDSFVEPFFTEKCLGKRCTLRHKFRLKAERKDLVENHGIKFNKTPKDVENYMTFMSSNAPRSKATENNEWYTPPEVIEAARQVMGIIDLDPASCEVAQETVKATRYYTEEDDGLAQQWFGKVWMNPPFTMPARKEFCKRMKDMISSETIEQACILLNNVVIDQAHIQELLSMVSSICLVAGRLRFLREDGKKSKSPLWGQFIVYYGENVDKFEQQFQQFGQVFKK